MDLVVVAPDDDLHMEMVNQCPRSISIRDGITVTWKVPLAKADGFSKLIELAFYVAGEISIGVAAHVIADWMLVRFRGKSEKIIIHRREIEFDAGQISRIVEETIMRDRQR